MVTGDILRRLMSVKHSECKLEWSYMRFAVSAVCDTQSSRPFSLQDKLRFSISI